MSTTIVPGKFVHRRLSAPPPVSLAVLFLNVLFRIVSVIVLESPCWRLMAPPELSAVLPFIVTLSRTTVSEPTVPVSLDHPWMAAPDSDVFMGQVDPFMCTPSMTMVVLTPVAKTSSARRHVGLQAEENGLTAFPFHVVTNASGTRTLKSVNHPPSNLKLPGRVSIVRLSL